MMYSKPIPTDEEIETFQENHKRRMEIMEQRFNIAISKEEYSLIETDQV